MVSFQVLGTQTPSALAPITASLFTFKYMQTKLQIIRLTLSAWPGITPESLEKRFLGLFGEYFCTLSPSALPVPFFCCGSHQKKHPKGRSHACRAAQWQRGKLSELSASPHRLRYAPSSLPPHTCPCTGLKKIVRQVLCILAFSSPFLVSSIPPSSLSTSLLSHTSFRSWTQSAPHYPLPPGVITTPAPPPLPRTSLPTLLLVEQDYLVSSSNRSKLQGPPASTKGI